jgi:membrane protein DedA with SNARE-associated domain/rhodanese-related sulfurtransferase
MIGSNCRMNSLFIELWAHGYRVLFALVLLETFGFPVPAAVALFVAGAAAAHGSLSIAGALGCGVAAMLLGDSLMYVLGRYTGWWLLGILCRLSLNPESCILRSADAFFKRGRALLMFAKFVPGINTLAPPMAGSMNMRFLLFLRYDFVGTILYNSAYLFAGVLFSGALDIVTKGYRTFNGALSWILIVAVVVYAGLQIWYWFRAKALRYAPTIEVDEAAADLAARQALVYDVRSHGYYDARTLRIQGSRRLDPNAFYQWHEQVPGGVHIYLYCTCIREATSARVALLLLEQGVACRVIRGGLRKWKAAGLPLERVPSEEVSDLPVFG